MPQGLKLIKLLPALKWLLAVALEYIFPFLVLLAAIITAILLYIFLPEKNARQSVPRNTAQTAAPTAAARTAAAPADDGGDSGSDEGGSWLGSLFSGGESSSGGFVPNHHPVATTREYVMAVKTDGTLRGLWFAENNKRILRDEHQYSELGENVDSVWIGAYDRRFALKADATFWAWASPGSSRENQTPHKVQDNVRKVIQNGAFTVTADGKLWAIEPGTREQRNADGEVIRDKDGDPIRESCYVARDAGVDGVVDYIAAGNVGNNYNGNYYVMREDGTVWIHGMNSGDPKPSLTRLDGVSDVVEGVYLDLPGEANARGLWVRKKDGSLRVVQGNPGRPQPSGNRKLMDGVTAFGGNDGAYIIDDKANLYYMGGVPAFGGEIAAAPEFIMSGVHAADWFTNSHYNIRTDGTVWAFGHNNYGSLTGRQSDANHSDPRGRLNADILGSDNYVRTPVKLRDEWSDVTWLARLGGGGGGDHVLTKRDNSLWLFYRWGEDGKAIEGNAPVRIMENVKSPEWEFAPVVDAAPPERKEQRPAPAAKPAPAKQAAPVAKPAPAAKPVPAKKPAPAKKPVPAKKPAPVKKPASAPKPAPTAKKTTVARIIFCTRLDEQDRPLDPGTVFDVNQKLFVIVPLPESVKPEQPRMRVDFSVTPDDVAPFELIRTRGTTLIYRWSHAAEARASVALNPSASQPNDILAQGIVSILDNPTPEEAAVAARSNAISLDTVIDFRENILPELMRQGQ